MHKTAYDMRISDWSSDVCSSDLREADGIPAPGTRWMSRAGADLLGARVGDAVSIGQSRLRLAALVVQEPDAAMDYFNVAPKVFLNLADLSATGLVQEGSRVRYRLVVAGDAAAVRSDEHTPELQSLMRTSHAALCAKQK